MTSIDELHPSRLVQDSKEHSGIAAYFCMAAQEPVHMVEHARRVGAEGHSCQRTLEHCGPPRRAHLLSADVGQQKRGALFVQRKNIEVVASHGQAGEIDARDSEMRVIAEILRQKRLLNVARDTDLLLEALALALAFDQASVVENACGVCGQRVENLLVKLGKSRWAFL